MTTSPTSHQLTILHPFLSDEEIKQHFKWREAEHKFFSPKEADSQTQQQIKLSSLETPEDQYVKAFKFNNLITTYIERGTNKINLADYAYKTLVCFGKDFEQAKNKTTDQTIITKFIQFLSANSFHLEKLPVNSCMEKVILPEKSENVTLPIWQKMIQKKGIEALKLFACADIAKS